jgi:hypothetical protein
VEEATAEGELRGIEGKEGVGEEEGEPQEHQHQPQEHQHSTSPGPLQRGDLPPAVVVLPPESAPAEVPPPKLEQLSSRI